jgi:hypothetical protein
MVMKKKSNSQICREHLLAALSALPDDNRMFTAKSLIRKAMNEVEHVESKRVRHANTQNQLRIEDEWKKQLASQAASTVDPAKAFDQISKLIEDEKKKLNTVKPTPKLDTLLD